VREREWKRKRVKERGGEREKKREKERESQRERLERTVYENGVGFHDNWDLASQEILPSLRTFTNEA